MSGVSACVHAVTHRVVESDFFGGDGHAQHVKLGEDLEEEPAGEAHPRHDRQREHHRRRHRSAVAAVESAGALFVRIASLAVHLGVVGPGGEERSGEEPEEPARQVLGRRIDHVVDRVPWMVD